MLDEGQEGGKDLSNVGAKLGSRRRRQRGEDPHSRQPHPPAPLGQKGSEDVEYRGDNGTEFGRLVVLEDRLEGPARATQDARRRIAKGVEEWWQ